MSGKVIAVSTNKGGVLKTSITTNLAGVYSKQGLNVLIIDMDNQGNAVHSFGHFPNEIEDTIYDVLVDGMAAEHAIMNVEKNIDILPSNKRMRKFERNLNGKNKELRLTNACNHLKNQYDIILVDSPPALGLAMDNIFAFADYVLIPYQPENFATLALIEAVEAIQEAQEEFNPDLKILGIIATLVDGRAGLHGTMMQELRQYALQEELPMFETIIPRSIRFADELKKQGKPATLSLPKHPVVQNYYELAKEIEKKW